MTRQRGCRIAGLGLRWHTWPEADPVAQVMGWLPRAAARACELEVRLVPGSGPAEPRPAAPWQPIFFHGRTQVYGLEAKVALWDLTSQLFVDPTAGTITGVVHPGSLDDGHTFSYATLLIALAALMRGQSRFHLHGGLVTVPGVGPVLVPGDAGRGKSTTVLSLLEAGGLFVSDDTLFVEAGGQRVHGFAKPIHVHPRTAAAFPRLAPLFAQAPQAELGKRSLAPDSVVGARLRRSLPAPRVLLFPFVANQPRTELEPLDEADRLGGLLGASALVAVDGLVGGQAHLDALQRLAHRARGFSLALGADALERPALVPELVRRATG